MARARDELPTASERALLTEAFLASAPSEVARRLGDRGALAATLAELCDQARRTWPDLGPFQAERFVAHLAQRFRASADPLGALSRLHAADLFLAQRCCERSPAAMAQLERRLREPSLLRSISGGQALLEDTRQALLVTVLLGRDGGQPAIADYSGRGSLERWLRAAALHSVTRQRRREQRVRHVDGEGALEASVGLLDPDLAVVKSRHKDQVNAAFREALAGLDSRERTLLRHFVAGVSMTRMATMYRVHKATVSRWIATARDELVAGTRARLLVRLGLNANEADSLIRAVRSDLDAGFESVLSLPATPRSGQR